MKTIRRSYDHRIKEAIVRTGNINLFPDLNIPQTTARNWIRRGIGTVVTVESFNLEQESLAMKCVELGEEVSKLNARFKLLKFVSATLGLGVQYQRFKSDNRFLYFKDIHTLSIDTHPLNLKLNIVTELI